MPAAQWFARMRRWLSDRPQGMAQVLRSAMQHLERRRMTRELQPSSGKHANYVAIAA
jgi:hypothetical protein